jgi:large subunit ribosomal protein L9
LQAERLNDQAIGSSGHLRSPDGPITRSPDFLGAIMEVILKEDVATLGSRGDVVKVAEGYGRNFLLPRKLAIEASADNKKVIEQMRAAAVRRSAKEKAQAEELSKQFDGLSVSFQRRSGDHDQLFGSVTSGDIADALERKAFNIDRRKIQLHEPLKTLGEFTIPVKLHKDVTAHLKVVIEKEAVAE